MLKNKNKVGEEKVKPAKIGKDLDFASSEAYNLLRTNLSFSLPDKVGGKLIGITSPCPRDGKSTTSLNLAYSEAEAGHKVLLIDGDMRCPSLAKTLDLESAPGLSNLLVDCKEEAIRNGVLHENMSVLLAGNIPPNPSELVASERMKKLLEEMAGKYDYVIIDLPPVNAVADPLAISKYIDGMIVVVRHGVSRRKEVMEAIRQLKQVNAKIFGFVYNGTYKGSKPRA